MAKYNSVVINKVANGYTIWAHPVCEHKVAENFDRLCEILREYYANEWRPISEQPDVDECPVQLLVGGEEFDGVWQDGEFLALPFRFVVWEHGSKWRTYD